MFKKLMFNLNTSNVILQFGLLAAAIGPILNLNTSNVILQFIISPHNHHQGLHLNTSNVILQSPFSTIVSISSNI